MLRFIARASVVAGMVFGAAIAFAFSTGPPASRTGAPAIGGKAAEPNCTACHNSFPVNQPDGMVELLDLPVAYSAGQVYPIRVRLTSTANQDSPTRKWGFELTTAYVSNGQSAGTWILPASPSDSLRTTNGTVSTYLTRLYVTHTSPSSHKDAPSPSEWSFSWVAPPVDSGSVVFCVAGNAANGDSTRLDDQIYTARDTVLAPSLVVGVPGPSPGPAYRTELAAPAPNPMTWLCVDVSFELAREGQLDLAIYDLQGRRVRSLFRGWRPAGPGAAFWDGKRDDGSQATNGVYFVRLRAPGEARAISRRLVLAR